jgi:hypothetical protein
MDRIQYSYIRRLFYGKADREVALLRATSSHDHMDLRSSTASDIPIHEGVVSVFRNGPIVREVGSITDGLGHETERTSRAKRMQVWMSGNGRYVSYLREV